jgi:hypothetical protein
MDATNWNLLFSLSKIDPTMVRLTAPNRLDLNSPPSQGSIRIESLPPLDRIGALRTCLESTSLFRQSEQKELQIFKKIVLGFGLVRIYESEGNFAQVDWYLMLLQTFESKD